MNAHTAKDCSREHMQLQNARTRRTAGLALFLLLERLLAAVVTAVLAVVSFLVAALEAQPLPGTVVVVLVMNFFT